MDPVARFGVDLPAIQGQHWTPHKLVGAETGPRRSVGLGSPPVTVGQLGSEIRAPTTRGTPSDNRLS
jgi:hypothetical protein